MAAVDPFTSEIIQASFAAIGEEMFVALRNTAMSAIIYEVLDMGTGLTDAAGQLAAAGCGIPTFAAVMDKAVRRVLELHGPGIRPGDLFISNDPDFGAVSHLNDVALLLPVFAGDALVAWTGNIAHWPDIGGAVPGSMSTSATEIWQEGVRLPAVRLFDRGEPVAPVFDILRANSRVPDVLNGDLWAGISAARVGERRVRELAERYGASTLCRALDDAMDYGERLSVKALAAVPKGVFERAERQETGEVWRVRIDIRDDAFIVDLRDNPDQSPGPYNLSRDGAVIAAQLIFKSVTAPGTICNGGALRPLRVLTRPGSVFDPRLPAAHGFYFEVRVRLHDLLWRCLAAAMPDRLPAGHFASICSTVLSGLHPDTGRHATVVEPQPGGWGACRDRDGLSAQFSAMHGETYNCPAEVSEARHGLLVQRFEFSAAEGGEGQYRGGRGIEVEYQIRAQQASLTIGYGRSQTPPWGLAGGLPGTPNFVELLRVDGTRERHSDATALPLRAGDRVRIVTGTGGGYGDPRMRSRRAIETEVADGLISAERAERVYGLEPTPS